MNKPIKITFILLLVVFGALMAMIMTPLGWMTNAAAGPGIVFGLMAVVFLLASAMIFLTLKEKITGWLKKYLLLTGGSAVGFFVFVVLHNLTGALLGLILKTEIEEPVFFILAVIVAPLGFIAGAIGSFKQLFSRKE